MFGGLGKQSEMNKCIITFKYISRKHRYLTVDSCKKKKRGENNCLCENLPTLNFQLSYIKISPADNEKTKDKR